MTFSVWAIFGAGVLTFASPCVLPLMPIYLATIVGSVSARARTRYTLFVATAFAAGFTAVFVALGALASSLGGVLVAYQRPIALLSAVMMILFGLRALGVLRLSALERDVRPGLRRVPVTGPFGAFVFGGAFALGWSPCIGPVLASVLTYAATHSDSPATGAFYLAVYAAGIALPMLLLAAAAGQAGRFVQRARRLLPLLERVTAAALIVLGVVTFYTAAHSGAAAGVQASAAPGPAGPNGAACELSAPGHTCALPEAAALDAAPAVGRVVSDGSPRLLEFSSHECPVCKRMRPVLDRLASACSELDAVIVHVDVSTAHGRALAAQHGVRGTPTYVLVDGDGVERARLLGENTGEAIAAAVEHAFGLSCWG